MTHGENAALPDNPFDGYYTYAREDGKVWTGENITSDITIIVTKHLNVYTITYIGDYQGAVAVTHGENAVLPSNPADGYYTYATEDSTEWAGENVTSSVTVIVTKHLNVYTITYIGDYQGAVTITHGENTVLPDNPYGYHYVYYTADGAEWTGENVTGDAVITVTKNINVYTVTFSGAYTGTQQVEHGSNVVIPEAPEGYIYTYTANASNITSDRIVTLDLVCDMAELAVSGLEYAFYDGNVINGEYYDLYFPRSNISVSPNAVYKVVSFEHSDIVLRKGENIITIIVTAESGRVQKYTLNINRNIPDSLGALVFRQTVGGDVTLYLPQGIKGNPGVVVKCTSDSATYVEQECEYNKQNNTITVYGLSEGTDYTFTVTAMYDGISVQSEPVWATTGELKSTDCYITKVVRPKLKLTCVKNGKIHHLMKKGKFLIYL